MLCCSDPGVLAVQGVCCLPGGYGPNAVREVPVAAAVRGHPYASRQLAMSQP